MAPSGHLLQTVFVLLILLGSSLGTTSSTAKTQNTGEKCECAGFPLTTAKDKELPLITQNPINVTCDDEGKKVCQAMCLDLVKIAKDRAPDILCEHLGHATNLKPSLFTRTCEGTWIYSGFTAENLTCCHDGKHTACEGQKLPTAAPTKV